MTSMYPHTLSLSHTHIPEKLIGMKASIVVSCGQYLFHYMTGLAVNSTCLLVRLIITSDTSHCQTLLGHASGRLVPNLHHSLFGLVCHVRFVPLWLQRPVEWSGQHCIGYVSCKGTGRDRARRGCEGAG